MISVCWIYYSNGERDLQTSRSETGTLSYSCFETAFDFSTGVNIVNFRSEIGIFGPVPGLDQECVNETVERKSWPGEKHKRKKVVRLFSDRLVTVLRRTTTKVRAREEFPFSPPLVKPDNARNIPNSIQHFD